METSLGESEDAGTDLESMVNAAVAGGGKKGALSDMLNSLEDSSPDELGEGMSQTDTKADEKRMLNNIYQHFADPVSMLQISKWTWEGPVPKTGIPAAPDTPTSTE